MRTGPRAANEQASTFILGVMIAGVASCVVLSYLELLNFQLRQESRAEAWHKALPLAEAAVEEGLAAINSTTNLSTLGFSASAGKWQRTRELSSGSYQVTISNLALPSVIGTAFVTNQGTTVSRIVQVVARPKTFSYGALARSKILSNGNNTRLDSYDSSNPLYSTLGLWDVLKATDQTIVGCLSASASSVDLGNGNIYGTVSLPQGGSISVGPNGGIGTFAWSTTNKGIETGYTNDQLRAQINDAQLPTLGALWTPPNGKVSGVNYDMILGNGDYSVATLSGKVLVQAVANLVVTSSINLSGSDTVSLSPGARLTIYMEGASASIKGNGVLNPGCSTNLVYYGLASNTTIDLSGNASFNGLIYAPEANITVGGGGGNNQDLSGAIVCNSISLNGNARFHYDLNARKFNLAGFVPSTWAEL